ncbi:MAG TPA: hypothetical protein VNG51_16545 [Ktedonobacteraceae bacterium]|nr:hypothetical protein [Ktedonobacteraceae bacterium]
MARHLHAGIGGAGAADHATPGKQSTPQVRADMLASLQAAFCV